MTNGAASRSAGTSDTLDLLVLQLLAVTGPLHGYGIAARLDRLMRDTGTTVELCALYPSLTRLVQRRLVEATSVTTHDRRTYRQYGISTLGRRHLEHASGRTEPTTSLLAGILREHDRHTRDLDTAREVQMHLFPQHRPDITGFAYAGACRPALDVGGDYYDFIRLTPTTLGLAIGDVSGKGVSAALLMATLAALVRSQAATGAPPARLMASVNRLLHDSSGAERFASLFYAVYDAASCALTYANAGHPAPVLLEDGTSAADARRLDTGGPVLGLLPDATYEQAVVHLECGSLLVGFTDGITEARNAADAEWGDAGVLQRLMRCGSLTPDAVVDRILGDVERFAAGADQHDDMTLLAARRTCA